jgi:hypothetical protein
LRTTAVGIPDVDLVAQPQPQSFDDRLRQYQHGGAGIDDPWDPFPAHLICRQQPAMHQGHIIVVSYLEFDSDSAHAIGSNRTHDLLPFAGLESGGGESMLHAWDCSFQSN